MINAFRKSFCVPYNGDIRLVESLSETSSELIKEFYGTDDFFPSGRWKNPNDNHPLSEVMKVLQKSGIEFNYLLNSIVFDDYLVNRIKLKEHLLWLKDIGVTSITCTTPFILDLVKSIGFQANTTLMQNIRSATAVEYYETLGYSRILVCEDDIRNVSLIKDMASSTELPLEVIVDNVCLMECPFRQTHLSSEGIRHPAFPDELRQYMSAYARQCKQFWHHDPSLFLKTSWVRPEELLKLKSAGVSLFKLGGRGIETDAIIKKLMIYSSGNYEGNIFDYLKPHMDCSQFLGIAPIDNKSLDEYFDFFFNGHCTKCCHKCQHCNKWAERLVKMNPSHWRNREFSGGLGEIIESEEKCLEGFSDINKPNKYVFGFIDDDKKN